MKKCLLMAVIAFVLTLSGCGKETTAAWQSTAELLPEKVYTIIVGVPKDAGEVFSTDEQKVYRHEGGEYEIRTQVFTAESIEAAVRALVGEKADKVSVRRKRCDLQHRPCDGRQNLLCRYGGNR